MVDLAGARDLTCPSRARGWVLSVRKGAMAVYWFCLRRIPEAAQELERQGGSWMEVHSIFVS